MRRFLIGVVAAAAVAWPIGVQAHPGSTARTVRAYGELDCNGLSRIERPIAPHLPCADPHRIEDNGRYVGHDEPTIGFFSTVRNSSTNLQWEIKLPIEHPLPATQSFENYIAFWLSLDLCDPHSYPQNPCTPGSDTNQSGIANPRASGSAFLELQFYRPGNPPYIRSVGCDIERWCAASAIFSIECNFGFSFCNNNCFEPANFAFIQVDGVPAGPPGPTDATIATFTPNGKTLFMNEGDVVRITIKDSPTGLLTKLEDLTTHTSGFMIASASNGFEATDLATCDPISFSFRPEFLTAKPANYGSWLFPLNVNFSMEIGHFIAGRNGDGDPDDAPCFGGPLVVGCIGTDKDFDGNSYRPDWPDGTRRSATSLEIGSVLGNGIGPVTFTAGGYTMPYHSVEISTIVSQSEPGCKPNGNGCEVPPPGAAFYPFYGISKSRTTCTLTFGNDIRGSTTNDFGRDEQYGEPVPGDSGVIASGVFPNPCVPQ